MNYDANTFDPANVDVVTASANTSSSLPAGDLSTASWAIYSAPPVVQKAEVAGVTTPPPDQAVTSPVSTPPSVTPSMTPTTAEMTAPSGMLPLRAENAMITPAPEEAKAHCPDYYGCNIFYNVSHVANIDIRN